MTLREEIKKVLLSTGLVFDEKRTDEIIKLFEKLIDSIMQEEISKSHHFELMLLDNDLSTTDAIVRVCRKMKEELKK